VLGALVLLAARPPRRRPALVPEPV